jgi:hypothetical protein
MIKGSAQGWLAQRLEIDFWLILLALMQAEPRPGVFWRMRRRFLDERIAAASS